MGKCKAISGLLLSTLENLFLTGVVFGWYFLLPVFQQKGIIECPSGKVERSRRDVAVNYNAYHKDPILTMPHKPSYSCPEEEDAYNLIYMISIFSPYVFVLIAGIILDSMGTRIVRLMGIVLIISGAFMLAYTAPGPDLRYLLYAGMPCLSAGGALLILTNIYVSNWFFSGRSVVISFMIGCFCSSSGMFLGFNALHLLHPEISLKYLFFGLAGLTIIPIITTFAIHPVHHIYESGKFNNRYSHIGMNCKKIYRQTRAEGLTSDPDNDDDRRSSAAVSLIFERETYRSVSCTPMFILHVFWFAVLQLQYWWMYWLTINEIETNEPELEYRYEVFQYAPICMIIMPIFIGVIMDERRHAEGKKYLDMETIHVKAIIIPVALVTVIAAALAGLPFLEMYKETKYAVDALIIINKPLTLATSACFLFQALPQLHFGRLVGVTLTVGGAFGVQYYPLRILLLNVLDGNPMWINVGMAVLVFLAISHPIYLIVRSRQLEEESERRTMNVIWAADTSTYIAMEELGRGGQAGIPKPTTEL